ncbi:MAG: hypothetical protein VX252_11385 [Myxococcota bacterium]|nr:hypothetical protein [Myxococcota bacterium]
MSSSGFLFSGPTSRPRTPVWLGVLLLFFAGTPAGVGAAELLDATDRALLGRLGSDVKRTAIPAIDPDRLIEAFTRAQSWPFTIMEGPKKGQQVELSVQAPSRLPGSGKALDTPVWALEIPGVMKQYAEVTGEGLQSPIIMLDRGTFAASYLPYDPVLLRKIDFGQSKTFAMQVKVHPQSDFSETEYEGQIQATYTNKGSYRFDTPSGTYDGVIIATEYRGTLGPATMDNRNLRIYSPKDGLVAMVAHDRLHAILLVDEDKFITLLRAAPARSDH